MSLKAPVYLRTAVADELTKRNYPLVSMDAIDAQLRELGFTDGGQLRALKLDMLETKVAADWYCYGNILDYELKSLVAVTQRKVDIQLKCVNGKTNTVVFENEGIGVNTTTGACAAADLAVHTVGVVAQSIKNGAKAMLPGNSLKKAADATDQMADVDFSQETREAIHQLLQRLPS